MLTYAFLAILNGQVYVLDHDLSANDCAYAMTLPIHEIQVSKDQWVSAVGASLACEEEEVGVVAAGS